MGLQYEHTKFWGLTLEDYSRMFLLSNEELLTKRILDCKSGFSSFNYELTQMGGDVTSVDPIYAEHQEELEAFLTEFQPEAVRQLNCHLNQPVKAGHLLEILLSKHHRATGLFFQDLPEGRKIGRYQVETLPFLPFKDEIFDLALSANVIFQEESPNSETLYIASLLELTRVAKEVRLYPITTNKGKLPSYLNSCFQVLNQEGVHVEAHQSDYQLSNEPKAMLKLFARRESDSRVA